MRHAVLEQGAPAGHPKSQPVAFVSLFIIETRYSRDKESRWISDGRVAAAASGATSEVPLLENAVAAVLRARRVLSSTSTIPPLHGAARRGFSLVGERESEAAPVPVAAVPVVALLCRSQLSSRHNTRRFYTSSRHDGGDTRYMPARVHTHTCTDDASSRRRTHAARRRRGRRRHARISYRAFPRGHPGDLVGRISVAATRCDDDNRHRSRGISIGVPPPLDWIGARARSPRVRASRGTGSRPVPRRSGIGSLVRVRVSVYVRMCVTYDNLLGCFGAPPECVTSAHDPRPNPSLYFSRRGHRVSRVDSEGRRGEVAKRNVKLSEARKVVVARSDISRIIGRERCPRRPLAF